jgi:hypothetical protein
MVRPHDEAEHGNRQAGEGDEAIPEDLLSRECRDEFALHAERGQDHDIHRRMRVEPEQVLKQDRITAHGGIENADTRDSLKGQQQNRNGYDRRAENHDQAGSVV